MKIKLFLLALAFGLSGVALARSVYTRDGYNFEVINDDNSTYNTTMAQLVTKMQTTGNIIDIQTLQMAQHDIWACTNRFPVSGNNSD